MKMLALPEIVDDARLIVTRHGHILSCLGGFDCPAHRLTIYWIQKSIKINLIKDTSYNKGMPTISNGVVLAEVITGRYCACSYTSQVAGEFDYCSSCMERNNWIANPDTNSSSYSETEYREKLRAKFLVEYKNSQRKK